MKLAKLIIFTLLCSLSANAEETIRVNVLSLLKPEKVAVQFTGSMLLISDDSANSQPIEQHRVEISVTPDKRSLLVRTSKSEIEANAIDIKPAEQTTIQVELLKPNQFSRAYSGALRLTPIEGRIEIVLMTNLEIVARASLLKEFGIDEKTIQASLAGLVCIRSYLKYQKKVRQNYSFDIYDHTGNIFFTSDSASELAYLQAFASQLDEVADVVLTRGNRIIPGYFSASCGGQTFDIKDIWGGSDYSDDIIGVECNWCSLKEKQTWQRSFNKDKLLQILGIKGRASGTVQIIIDDENCFRFVGGGTELDSMTPEEIRIIIGRKLGWDTLPSNNFRFISADKTLIVYGSGRGHGIGLCQTGAQNQALNGMSWREILQFYFPRCTPFKLED
jgi:stage II sporulation protein D